MCLAIARPSPVPPDSVSGPCQCGRNARYAIQVLVCDPRAEIANEELDLCLEFPRSDANALPTLAVFHGIFDQIAEDLVQRIGIGEDEFVSRLRRSRLTGESRTIPASDSIASRTSPEARTG